MKKIKNHTLFGILFILIFSSIFINAIGYPNDLSINDPDSYEILPENLSGDEYFQLRGTGSYTSATSGNGLFDYQYENGYDITIPNYDYAGATIELSPKYYYRDVSLGSFSYTTTTTRTFSSGFSYVSDLSSRVSSISYATRYSTPDVVGLNYWYWANMVGGSEGGGATLSDMENGLACDGSTGGVYAYRHRQVYVAGQSTRTQAGIEIGFEITNSRMGTTGELDWDNNWALTNTQFNVWLHSAYAGGETELVKGHDAKVWIEIMAKTPSGTVYSYQLDYRSETASLAWGNVMIYASELTGAGADVWCFGGYNPTQIINSYSSINLVDVNRYSTQTQSAGSTGHYTHTAFTSTYGNPIITYRVKGEAWHNWWLGYTNVNIRSTEANSKQSFTYTWGSGSMNHPYDAYFQLSGDSNFYSLNTNSRRRSGWNNRYNLGTSDLMSFYSDYYNGYESISVSVHHANAYHYVSDTNTRNSLSFVGITMTRESNKWRLYSPDLNASSIYFLTGDHAYLDMLLSITSWDSGWGSYIGLIWSFTLSFEEFAYNSVIPYSSGSGSLIYGESGYYRHIDIDWNEIILTDAYVKTLLINSIPQSITPEFQSYTGGDVPQWKTERALSINWAVGSGGVSINIDITTDIIVPIITDYSTISFLHDGESFEFNVTGTDEIHIMEALLILDDYDDYFERYSLPLIHKTGNTYYHMSSLGDILPANYSAWYGLQDDAGNWVTTTAFDLFVNATQIYIVYVELEDYEYGTTGNYLNFTLTDTYPDSYEVNIDNILISSGTWVNPESFNVNIDGYGIGIYNVTIFANDTLGKELWYNDTFRVYQTPIFLEKPSDANYVFPYEAFELFWNITNNGLTNYSLLLNNVPLLEDNFTNPYNDIVYIAQNTSTLGLGSFNYTLIVRDNDTLIIQDVVLIQIIPYASPLIDIIEPSEAIITDISPQLIECAITSMLEVPIVSVQWDLKLTTDYFDWNDMDYNGTYYAYFNPLDYEYGDYDLWINVTDLFTNISSSKEIRLEQFIPYNIEGLEITWKSSEIDVGLLDEDTTDIVAYFNLIHHSIAMERDFGIEIPAIYNDAYNYYINRGFNRYEPSFPYFSGTYTEWHLPTFQLEDTVYFELEKPTLRNDVMVIKDDGTIEMEFTLNSKHAFTNLTIHNTITYFFTDVSTYTYFISYLFEGEWYNLNSTDFLFEYEAFISFELYWDEIGSDSTVVFRFQAIPIPEVESPINWVVAGIFIPIGLFFWLLFAGVVGRKWEDWGVPRFILYSGIVAGASFGVGILVGFLIQGSIFTMIIPHG